MLSGLRRPARLSTAVIFAVSIAFIMMCLTAAVVGFFPRPTYGFEFSPASGEVLEIVPGGPAAAAGITVGDRIVDVPRGNGRRGYRLEVPREGDTVRVSTHAGVATVTARLQPATLAVALFSCLNLLSSIAVCLFAVLLCVRRPGPMSTAFWFFALGITVPGIYPLCARLPVPIGSALVAVNDAISGFVAGLVLIPFALRFPTGNLPSQQKTLERLVWAACVFMFLGACAFGNSLNFGGAIGDLTRAWIVVVLSCVPLPIAAGILINRYVRSSPVERAKTAWALTGFGGAIAMNIVVWAFYIFFAASEYSVTAVVISEAIGALISLFPLLAIYPVVRYQLFDISFVVNRATLYSALTLAAFATLAAVNWLAQHLVTERLAFVLQPVAAIAIGLGYFRVRESAQRFIERTIFRRRFEAEVHFADMAATFANVSSAEALDDALVTDVCATLALRSAAVFRLRDGVFSLRPRIGWPTAEVELPSSGPLGGPDGHILDGILALPASLLPSAADRPVAAFELRSGARLMGFALYGRHTNGTEIDPEELALLRKLIDAAGTAYRLAELQAELISARNEVAALRSIAK